MWSCIMSKERMYSSYTDADTKELLNKLSPNSSVCDYQQSMIELGEKLGQSILGSVTGRETLLISTAEDADFLQAGVRKTLISHHISVKTAVFWNNHYQLGGGQGSVAPIVHRFIEPELSNIDNIIINKSVISGSCVVKTNLIALLDKLKQAKDIFVLAPVVYIKAQESLSSDFPSEIANKFKFVYFACDSERDKSGEVIPGIGGQVYERLGLSSQPVSVAYIPKIVQQLALSMS